MLCRINQISLPFATKETKMAAVVRNGKSTLFCGGLTEEAEEEIIVNAFIPFGEVLKVQLPDQFKGYCFVEFESDLDCIY